ncbi:interleukin-7 isoform X3 [Saccopteryx bilineata]|uniref:interleukin-7 isoform X3 n=1 Tax=Saccopteryx bilineata TaxID=59482 RepID=UPI0033906106
MPGTGSSGWHRERPGSGSCFFLFGGSSMVAGSHRHTSKFQTLAQNESIVFVRNTDFGWTRYIFGIPPLILVLLPVASSDCEIEGKSGEEYQHIIMVNFNKLDKEKKQPPPSEAQPTKNLGEKKSLKEQKKLDDICFLVTLLDKIQTCWNKILRGPEEH